MSCVTNVIFSCCILDEDVAEQINDFFKASNTRGFGFVSATASTLDCPRCAGGSKSLETPIAIGAFNHWNEQAFIEFLKKLPWTEPENVQIMFKGQEEDTFTIKGIV